MSLYDQLVTREAALAVVGLGYVGMPLAVAFDEAGLDVIGFDLNEEKIAAYLAGEDPTNEVGSEGVKNSQLCYTADESQLDRAKFFVVAVPTPINSDKTPDLSPVIGASRIVGRHLNPGAVIVYESTVYPGVTEDICARILEEESGLVCGEDFKIAYSPERINPGDKVHRLSNIVKIVSGQDLETRELVAQIYELIFKLGVHRASSIRVAEAAKVVENSQRDINIAFMNELAMAFDRMGIDTAEVIEAMNTKWNALGFRPGLVGGHCIGVDPYYFVYEAENLGYHSQIILAGRKVNDGMGNFVAEVAIREMVKAGLAPREANVAILGLTFKENCPDVRNSKVVDIIETLEKYDVKVKVSDPLADPKEVREAYGLELTDIDSLEDIDCLILAVAHEAYATLDPVLLGKYFGHEKPSDRCVLIDVKSLLNPVMIEAAGYRYWRL